MFVQLVSPAVGVCAIGAVNRHLWERCKIIATKSHPFTFSVGLRLGAGDGCNGFAKGVDGSSVSPAGKTIPGGSGERVGG